MITWRTELDFTCDSCYYNPDCHRELLMDQADAKTKGGMFRLAKQAGWEWRDNYCICPSCVKKRDETTLHSPPMYWPVTGKDGEK